jgi:hypothetical protein
VVVKKGELCIVYLPSHLVGPYLVLKNKGPNAFGEVTLQVLNSYTRARQDLEGRTSFDVMRKTVYKLGWFDPRDASTQYKSKKPAPRFEMYTVCYSEVKNRILATGFTLTRGNRLEPKLITWLKNNSPQNMKNIARQLKNQGQDSEEAEVQRSEI